MHQCKRSNLTETRQLPALCFLRTGKIKYTQTTMTAAQSASLAGALVARFLRSNNYTQTLDIFIREAGLSPDVGQTTGKDDSGDNTWTIEGVLEEKKTYDKSINFERHGNEGKGNNAWSVPGKCHLSRLMEKRIKRTHDMQAPSKPTIVPTPSASNLLVASVEKWQRLSSSHGTEQQSSYIVATGADRQLHLFKAAEGNALVRSFSRQSDSPILSYSPVRKGEYLFMTNMSGQLILQRGTEVLGRRKDHSKYAIQVVTYEAPNTEKVLVATAAWDSKISVYEFDIPREGEPEAVITMDEPVGYINLLTNPEAMLFVKHVDLERTVLLVSRQDSSHLHYYQVDSLTRNPTESTDTNPQECKLLGKQNLAPHSNTWVAFSPSGLALSPHDPGLLAVATSSLPHMKVMIVRLLFPPAESFDGNNDAQPEEPPAAPETQATQAFAVLALQNREDAAILVQANTFAPQTAYSTPQVAWRPDGSGVWVNGDDGVVRGIEVKTGKIAAMLTRGHDVGCKVRTIWAGWVEVLKDGGEVGVEEWVVSGGFDKRLIVWKR